MVVVLDVVVGIGGVEVWGGVEEVGAIGRGLRVFTWEHYGPRREG